ncbi:unnamed protein product [Linum tenue]|uniref:Uncharacterized protein n=1 Tax=Linum tenue TaxID=586396 RepID=A0AAV0IJH2_9ROSI|nr:unnamed protein product [Linum tenue]
MSAKQRKAGKKTITKPPPEQEIIILSDSESDGGTPVRPVFCLNVKNGTDLRKFDAIEDCFILDFDPYDQPASDQKVKNFTPDADIALISEKGQVACRDYPHARHLCAEFPFDKTPHQKYCSRCYCYVCDTAAPCALWEVGKSPHCHAMGQVAAWQVERDKMRNRRILGSKNRLLC